MAETTTKPIMKATGVSSGTVGVGFEVGVDVGFVVT